jgi:hypothetical protein
MDDEPQHKVKKWTSEEVNKIYVFHFIVDIIARFDASFNPFKLQTNFSTVLRSTS